MMHSHETESYLMPRMLVAVVDRDNSGRVEDILREKHAYFQYMLHAMGTASSENLKAFGLSGTEKTLCACVVPAYKAQRIMTAVKERMGLAKPGNGIVFSLCISGMSAAIESAFAKDFNEHRERVMEDMEHEAQTTSQEARYELVVAMVNQGYSDQVMDAARSAGAKGGTILHARRTGIQDAEKFFGISLQAEKELVAILAPRAQKTELMQAVSKVCGMKTEARGVILSLPVEDCAGIVPEDEDAL